MRLHSSLYPQRCLLAGKSLVRSTLLAPVIQTLDMAIQRINPYVMDEY